MQHKLDVLSKIALSFQQEDITYNVGASCMLYLRGVVTSFRDIDIMVKLEDIGKASKMMHTLGLLQPSKNKDNYQTKVFLEYIVEGVEVDIMAGFAIIHEQKEYYFPLENNQNADHYFLNDISIPLAGLEEWLTYYKLMKREDKVKIISSYLKK